MGKLKVLIAGLFIAMLMVGVAVPALASSGAGVSEEVACPTETEPVSEQEIDAKCLVSGTVYLEGNPVEGARVTARCPDGSLWIAYSRANGRYAIGYSGEYPEYVYVWAQKGLCVSDKVRVYRPFPVDGVDLHLHHPAACISMD